MSFYRVSTLSVKKSSYSDQKLFLISLSVLISLLQAQFTNTSFLIFFIIIKARLHVYAFAIDTY